MKRRVVGLVRWRHRTGGKRGKKEALGGKGGTRRIILRPPRGDRRRGGGRGRRRGRTWRREENGGFFLLSITSITGKERGKGHSGEKEKRKGKFLANYPPLLR